MQDNQQMKTTPNLLRNNVSKTNFTYKNKQNNFFNEITDKNITICRRFHKVYVLFNLKQNWPTYSNFCVNWEHIFTSFSLRYRWAILHQNHKKLLAGDREGFSLPYFFSHLFLSARYQPFQSSWRRGLFSPAIPTFYTHNPLKLEHFWDFNLKLEICFLKGHM